MNHTMLSGDITQPRLVLFASKEEFELLCSEAEEARQDVFTLGASHRLDVPYGMVTPGQRSLMKVTFMQVLAH